MKKFFTLITCITSVSLITAQLPEWSPVGAGMNGGGSVDIVVSGSGHVYMAGSMTFIDNVACDNVARFDGTTVEDVGAPLSGLNVVTAMIYWNSTWVIGVHNTTNTNRVYKLNGTNWEAMGASFDGHINCLEVYNNELYVGGQFSNYNDTVQMRRLCKWNGSTYVELGQTNLQVGMVYDLEVYNNELIVGMDNMVLNGYRNIAKYDGTTYSVFPVTFDYEVKALKTIGNKLYIGGGFLEQYNNGQDLNKIAVWDGSTLSPLGTGVTGSGRVEDIVEYNGNIVAVGGFTQIGSITTNYVASWDGSVWSKLSDESIVGSGYLNTAAVFNNKLFVAGSNVGVNGKGTCVFYLEAAASVENNDIIKTNVYPNPASEYIMVEAENIHKISLADVNGKVVSEVSTEENISQYSMNVNELNAGVYFIYVTTVNGTACSKLIKN